MKLKVGVFFGGVSCEHEISCISANQVLHALDSDKYEIIPVYISKDADLYTGDLLMELKNYDDSLVSKLTKVCLYKDGNKVVLSPVKKALFKNEEKNIDVAFLVMHGTNGEDGALQGLMEMYKLPYTSSNVLGSAIGQDKAVMKEVLEFEGVNVCPWFYFFYSDFEKDASLYIQKAKDLGFPLIAKPANLGSSIGIEVIHNEEEFEEKINEVGKYDFKIVVEKMVTNLKEVNISVMGNHDSFKLSAIEEVYKNDELLNFNDKYNPQGSKGSKGGVKTGKTGSKGMASTSRKVPAELETDQEATIKDMAEKTFKALNGFGCVRIDFMIDEDTGAIYVNEINSIPGSLAFYLWSEVGINFSEECDILINNALKRYAQKEKKTYSFDTNILSNYKGV